MEPAAESGRREDRGREKEVPAGTGAVSHTGWCRYMDTSGSSGDEPDDGAGKGLTGARKETENG